MERLAMDVYPARRPYLVIRVGEATTIVKVLIIQHAVPPILPPLLMILHSCPSAIPYFAYMTWKTGPKAGGNNRYTIDLNGA